MNYFRENQSISKKQNGILLILIMLFFFRVDAYAQTLSSGGWRTSSDNTFTRITANSNLGPKIYRLECTNMTDNAILQFKITVDGVIIPTTFQEGSNVVVEGSNVAIQQITPGVMVKGTWTIIQQTDIPATTIPWNYYPSLTNELLIASLKVEQEFLLSINYNSANCTNTSYSIMIDGQPVKDANNNNLKFLEGSTLYGKGKSVTIRANGTCTGNNPIYGDIKLKK